MKIFVKSNSDALLDKRTFFREVVLEYDVRKSKTSGVGNLLSEKVRASLRQRC